MTEDEKQQLRDHLAVILGHRSGDLPAAIAGLDQLKGSATGHLAHYLSKRSYQKAWILIEGGDPEAGNCHSHRP